MTISTYWVDPYLAQLELKDPKIFQELLGEMLRFPELHSGLAKNSTTPTALLGQMAKHYKDPKLIPPDMFENPNCPKELIDGLFDEFPEGSTQLTKLASNENLTRSQLLKLVEFGGLDAILAGRVNFPADLFVSIWENSLVGMEDAKFNLRLYVFKALACNPNTPLKILHNLSKYQIVDSPGLVESLLMSNPSLPPAMKAEFALLGFRPATNVLVKSDTEWFPTNKVFGIDGFSDYLLATLVKLGHPGGYLTSDELPPKDAAIDTRSIFDLWLSDQSIYKTLWPELREIQSHEVYFMRWLAIGRGFSYFEIDGLDLEHEDRANDGDINYHATWENTDWLPLAIDYSEALSDFSYYTFEDVTGWNYLEWAQAWILADYDPEFISLVEKDNVALQFIWDQNMDKWDDQRELGTVIEAELCKPYSWKGLSSEKKAFLIDFIKGVYESGEEKYSQYAEHYLMCIALNPNTDDDLIQKYFLNQRLDSDLINQAVDLRNTHS
jgi:hypothetical protein